MQPVQRRWRPAICSKRAFARNGNAMLIILLPLNLPNPLATRNMAQHTSWKSGRSKISRALGNNLTVPWHGERDKQLYAACPSLRAHDAQPAYGLFFIRVLFAGLS